MRTALALVAGLVVGLAGAMLLLAPAGPPAIPPSTPPVDSPGPDNAEQVAVAAQERIAVLEAELEQVRTELATAREERAAAAPLRTSEPARAAGEPASPTGPPETGAPRVVLTGVGAAAPPLEAAEIWRLLESDDPRNLVRGLRALDQLPDPGQAMDQVAAVLEQTDQPPWVQMTALRALANLGTPEATATLAPLVGAEPAWLASTAAMALGDLGDPTVLPTLQQAFPGSTGRARLDLAVAMRKLGDPEPTRLVAQETLASLASPEGGTRAAALRRIAALQDESLNPHLVQSLSDPAPDVRRTAAWALGDLGTAEDLPALQAMLGDPAPEVVQAAEQAMHLIEHPEDRRRTPGLRALQWPDGR